jgi:hypothetical protein
LQIDVFFEFVVEPVEFVVRLFEFVREKFPVDVVLRTTANGQSSDDDDDDDDAPVPSFVAIARLEQSIARS